MTLSVLILPINYLKAVYPAEENFKVSLVITVNYATCCSAAKLSAATPFHATNCALFLFSSSKTTLHQQHSCCIISEECRKGLLHPFGFCVRLSSLLHKELQLNLEISRKQNEAHSVWSHCSPISVTCTRSSPISTTTSTTTILAPTHAQNTSRHFQTFHFSTNNSYFAVRGWEKNFFCVQWQLKWRAESCLLHNSLS